MGFVGISRNANPCTLTHDVTLSEVRFSLQSVGIGLDWVPEHVLRFRAWQARHPYEAKPENIPDATLTLQRPGHSVPTAIELEMTIKNQARYEKIFRAYRWKQTFGCIWYLVPSTSIGERLGTSLAQRQ